MDGWNKCQFVFDPCLSDRHVLIDALTGPHRHLNMSMWKSLKTDDFITELFVFLDLL